ncbi:cytochrome c oxidase accessory protein FixG [Aliiroseovarius halocynthiae]|uniref:Cytochrome c oxidase accessory protein CcoG n=1 Tax=Aliiroseovarius halocynthiae TaxID=985055 RepID=A0A545SRP0_9RHOB|nr:cytochrome c oxidase accessory protein CcoG [Aliiroseovarius halocynthiae]TQV67622.1 cytochrome c oxidase accessory protein CcoG [Aliiroseovarius halocynthiae]SMR81647.1 cytochrome c oxidase accessory protein FixG [Aliiroseovarius halocynthiae]
MSDAPEQLYAPREPIFPKRVKGTFRSLKWWIMGLTLGVYYLAPWIRWDRGPNLPDQAILVDMANRRFFFFWIEIWPHEFYFIAGLLIMAGLGLFLFTSAAGRVWCGYTCPQTVWTDLMILVERWIEGDRNARIRLHRQKWDAEKIRKRIVKFIAWILIAVATGGAWVFYFADAPTLLMDLVTGQAHPLAYSTILVLTLTTFFFGGIAREQICIYACPWPRIQAAMMDEDTITIAYREWRGEPRGRGKKRDDLGDCIDCNACVAVCPMGIDIRDGQQMECITCGLCIDACDEMMVKVGKERGLIDYLALKDEAYERAGNQKIPVMKHLLRPRTILYTSLWTLVGVALTVAIFARPKVDVTIRPVRNPTYVTLSDGSIRNTYDVGVRNRHGEEWPYYFTLTDGSNLTVELEGSDKLVLVAPPDTEAKQRLYVVAPPGSETAKLDRSDLRIWVVDGVTGDRAHLDTVFNGKGR